MPLNPGQAAATSAAMDVFLSNGVGGHCLIGEGGTGKTYTTMEIVRQCVDAGLRVILTAPTNKAVKQLEKASRPYRFDPDRVVFKTLHSALGLALMPSEENKYANSVRDSILDQFDVVGVDEASMLGWRVLENYLLPQQATAGFKILMIGDDMQLPPVKEVKSTAFERFPCSELTQPERQRTNPDGSANGILELTAPLRYAIKNNKVFNLKTLPQNNVTLVKAAEFLQMIVENFDGNTDLDNIRVLAWRNDRVDEINNLVRRKLYGKDAPRYVVGERVVTAAPVKDGDGNVVLGVDEECIVKAITESSVFDEEGGNDYKTICLALEPIHAGIAQVFVHILHDDAQEAYDSRLATLRKRAEAATGSARGQAWYRWHLFQENFDNVRYCYAITVHRSQGSTYLHGFVDVKDILKNPRRSERQRLLYVAFSRFQEELAINKIGFIA